MACGRWNTRRETEMMGFTRGHGPGAPRLTVWRAAAATLLCFLGASVWPSAAAWAAPCDKPVYLTFDTGHMAVAPWVATVLNRHALKATFFLANERTQDGGTSLDDRWAPWWRARAAEGHAFGSHTWNHDIWRADVGANAFAFVPTAGPASGVRHAMDAAAYCAALGQSAARFTAMTGQPMNAIFRAAGGKTSPALLQTAKRCGWTHVGWSDAGFLGDELPSHTHPNDALLKRSLATIRSGDILLAHLGIWSRKDPWAPAVLEPLIVGLKQRGFCFATLREHPTLGAAANQPAPVK